MHWIIYLGIIIAILAVIIDWLLLRAFGEYDRQQEELYEQQLRQEDDCK